ncbi:uncharacterized protein LOC144567193 [Carex rostrata]
MEKANNKLKLKLIIDKKSNKVLFGEARRDLVDLIFSLLALPLGAITKLLAKDAFVGSIGEVYDSLSKINGTYILSYGKQSSLLNPPLVTPSDYKTNIFLPPSTYQDTKDRCLYICSSLAQAQPPPFACPSSTFGCIISAQAQPYVKSCCPYISLVRGTTCLGCGKTMDSQTEFKEPKFDPVTVVEVSSDVGKGCVEGEVTYSVMDDLTMVPMSTLSSIALLNKFEIKDLGSIQEITVTIGFEEGLELVKASLESKAILTDVFLKKNHASNAWKKICRPIMPTASRLRQEDIDAISSQVLSSISSQILPSITHINEQITLAVRAIIGPSCSYQASMPAPQNDEDHDDNDDEGH